MNSEEVKFGGFAKDMAERKCFFFKYLSNLCKLTRSRYISAKFHKNRVTGTLRILFLDTSKFFDGSCKTLAKPNTYLCKIVKNKKEVKK